MAFSTTPAYLGPIAAGDSDLKMLNASFVQYAAASSLPAAGNTGVLHIATDGTPEKIFVDNGTALIEYRARRMKRKASTESVSTSVTLQNDDDFVFAVLADEIWLVSIYAPTVTINLRIGWSLPSGATFVGSAFLMRDSADPFMGYAGVAGHASTTLSSSAGDGILQVHGVIDVASTAGNAQFQWAQGTSSGTTSLVAGAYMIAERMVI